MDLLGSFTIGALKHYNEYPCLLLNCKPCLGCGLNWFQPGLGYAVIVQTVHV